MKSFYVYFICLLFLLPNKANSLAVLGHAAIVDAAWDQNIVPLLKAKFPKTTPEELTTAHAYAYGGAIAPDMGSYPRGSVFFSYLVHYVRTGDMADALISESRNINEYAFALGFLSHYYADTYGHSLATNRSVPLTYPNLIRKYGTTITYADDPTSHARMEFGFDVLQLAKGNYTNQAFNDLIGFKVDTSVLARAFYKTYGLDINAVFHNRLNSAIGIFRFMVANIIPVITKVAWASKGSDIEKQQPGIKRRNFIYRFRLRQYAKVHGTEYKQPGFFPKLFSFFIRVMPKVGPFKHLKFKVPTALSETYLHQGLDTILLHYTADLSPAKINSLHRNKDLDTGNPVAACEYPLTDETYGEWVLQLKKENYKTITPVIRENISGFYNAYPQRSSAKACVELFNAVGDIKNSTQKK